MKIYTNGCSFTHGHDYFEEVENSNDTRENIGGKVIHEQSYKDYHYATHIDHTAWPWQLTNHENIDFVFNHALQSTGHNRLIRTTLDFLTYLEKNSEDLSEWIFVLQSSTPERRDYGTYDPNVFLQVYAHTEDSDSWKERVNGVSAINLNMKYYNYVEDYVRNPTPDMELLAKAVYDYHILASTNNINYYDVVKELAFISNLLENKGVKFLLTSMQHEFGSLHHDHNIHGVMAPYFYNVYDTINRDNILKAFSQICPNDDEYSDTAHPLPDGNKKFANYVLEEMEKRNWLT